MGTLVKPFTFSNGTVADATEVESVINTLYTGVNGNLDSANIATGGVGTSEIADDAVNENKIDWGTGANQVSLDDVPNGSTSKLGQDCSSTGNPTFTTVNIDTTGKMTSGAIEFMGANVPGWICNLGFTLSGGVLTITDAQGAALSTSNPGWVTVPSTTPGQYVTLKVTTPVTLQDDSHASSNLTNLGFGITESVNWGYDWPFPIYVVNRGNTNIDGADGSSVFALARNPCLHTSPSSSNDIGDTGAIPVNDSQNVILILDDVTVSNYTSLPMQLVSFIRMQWSTSTDDWTIQALNNKDGFGITQIEKTFAEEYRIPLGQNGAQSGNYLYANSGVAPDFSTNEYYVRLFRNGEIRCRGTLSGDGGTDGSGAVEARLMLPTTTPTGTVSLSRSPVGYTTGATTISSGVALYTSISAGNSYAGLRYLDAAAVYLTVNNNMYSNGGREITFDFIYKGFASV